MTEETIKALAERILGNHWDRFNQENREILLSTKFQDTIISAMCEMYKAAISGTGNIEEAFEKRLRDGFSKVVLGEDSDGNTVYLSDRELEQCVAIATAGTERVECYLPCEFSEGEIYAGTETGPLPLKLVTLTVVNPSKS